MNKPSPRVNRLGFILILGVLSTRMETVSHRSAKNLVFSPGAPTSSITARVFLLRVRCPDLVYFFTTSGWMGLDIPPAIKICNVYNRRG